MTLPVDGAAPLAPDDLDESFVPRVTDRIVEIEVEEGLVVVGGPRGGAQALNPTASLVWQLLDGEASVGELVDDLAAETGVARAVVAHDVLDFLRTLGRKGLLVGVEEPPPETEAKASSPAVSLTPGAELAPLTLTDLDGVERTLRDLPHARVLVVNWNPGCGYCETIAETLADLEAPLAAADVGLVLVASGDPEANRALVARAGLGAPVLLKREDDDPFAGLGTPAATVVDADGVIAAPLAMGAVDVPALAAALAGVELPSEAPPADSSDDGVLYLPAPIGMCGPGATAPGPRTEWAGTLALVFGDLRIGVRYSSGDTAGLLEKLFPGATLDDPRVPDNYSVALYPPAERSRELNLLVSGAQQVVRSRSRRRVLGALLQYVSSDLYAPDPTLLQVLATPAVRGDEAVLLPLGLGTDLKALQPRLARLGIALVDGPRALVDLDAGELVVPEPGVEHDPTVLDDLDDDVHLGASELPAVAAGRYPLGAWYLRRWDDGAPVGDDGDPDRLAPGLAVASTVGLCVTGDVAATATALATLVTRVPVRGVAYDVPLELVDALARAAP